jgi:hypothetical protein
MNKRIVLVLLWAGTVTLAWFLGRTGQVKQQTVPHRFRGEAADSQSIYRVDEAGPNASEEQSTKTTPGRRRFTKAPPPSFENVKTSLELVDLVLAWLDKRLREGPEGHKHIVRTAATIQEEDLKGIDFGQIGQMEFVVLRFVIQREPWIVDFAETMYRTAAETPEWFQERDSWVFEALSDEAAEVLPWIVSRKRLERFRDYTQRILAVPPVQMNPALRRVRSELEQNLKDWSAPLNEMELLTMIHSTDLDDARRLRLALSVANDQLVGVDIPGLVANRLRLGDAAQIEVLRKIPLTPADLALLDQAFLFGLCQDEGVNVPHYLDCTGREDWAEMRGIFDEGFSLGGAYALIMADALANLDVRVPKSYVQSVLRNERLPRPLRIKLRIKYLIED